MASMQIKQRESSGRSQVSTAQFQTTGRLNGALNVWCSQSTVSVTTPRSDHQQAVCFLQSYSSTTTLVSPADDRRAGRGRSQVTCTCSCHLGWHCSATGLQETPITSLVALCLCRCGSCCCNWKLVPVFALCFFFQVFDTKKLVEGPVWIRLLENSLTRDGEFEHNFVQISQETICIISPWTLFGYIRTTDGAMSLTHFSSPSIITKAQSYGTSSIEESALSAPFFCLSLLCKKKW